MARHYTGYRRYMTTAELEQILAYVGEHSPDYVLFIMQIMCWMGLRVGEACRIRHSDLTFEDGEPVRLTVELEKTGKVLDRLIPDRLKSRFMEYHRPGEGYMFSYKRHNQYSNPHVQPNSISWHLMKARRALDLDKVYYTKKNGIRMHRISNHVFRRYFLSRLFCLTKDMVLCKEVIGHADIRTTEVYVMPDMAQELKAINLI